MLSEWLEPIGARLLPLEMLHGLRNRLSGMKNGLVFVFLVALALVIPGIIIPTFSKIFVDDVLVQNKTTWARPLLLAMALTAVVQAALVYLQNSVLGQLENKLSVRMTASFLLHVLHLPVTFFAGTFAGDVAGRSLHNESVARQLAWELAPKMVRFLAVIFYLLLMAQYDLLLTAVVFGLGLLNLLPRHYLDPRRKKLLQQVDNHRGQLAGVAASGLQDVESVKASAAEADLFSVWAACQTRLANTMQPLEELSVALYATPALLELLNRSAILGLGGLRVLQGHFTIGDLVAYVALAESFIIPLGELAALGRVTQRIEADLRILDEVLDVPADPGLMLDQPAPTSGPAKLSGQVELRGISFGYDQAAPPLIQAFNLSLTPGKRVALVGGSGSGKSTLARVLAGLYEPWEGEVYFDGQPRRKIPRLLMTQSLMFVDQEIVLFEGTVRENLTLWDTTVADEDLVRAARDADIDNVIAARPGGYDSVVAEAGSNFSGGQRQRLEIARALVGNPTILIMDEATSALDSVTEKAIVDNLRRRGCTCVVVAHRLSTIRDCEEILVLERGQVVQRGTHPELYAAGGHYRDLITRH